MSGTSERVLRDCFGDLARRWLDLEAPALADEPDAVHQMRVTSRRLRALLRLWGDALRIDAGPLADDLRWVAHALGDVRDLDVLEDRLLADAGDEPGALAADLLRTRLDLRRVRAREALAHDVASARFVSIRIGVQGLLNPPVRRSWRGVGVDALVRIAARRARAAVRAFDATGLVEGVPPTTEQLQRLHHARRVAKSARYAAEALAEQGIARPRRSRGRKGPKAWGRAFTDVADALGLVQDTVVAEGYLRDLAEEVGPPASEVFVAMADREAARRPGALADSMAAVAAARRLVA